MSRILKIELKGLVIMKCKSCGAEVGMEYRLCPYCRAEIDYSNGIQKNGGNQPVIVVQNVLSNQNTNTVTDRYTRNRRCSPKKKNTALILSIFGMFGIHRFYVGKVGSGIIYLFTGGIFFFGWIYDMIKIASGTFTDGNGLPITK